MSEVVSFASEGYQLTGILTIAEFPNGKGALVLHPHPLYGGDMYNPVVTSLERTLLEYGYTTLRFNFRGTSSIREGFAGIAGAVVDAENALEIFELRGFKEIGIVGYSFGGSTALRLASMNSSAFLITLSASHALVTEGQYDATRLSSIDCPALMFHGTSDRMIPSDDLGLLSKLIGSNGIETVLLEREGHFYQRSMSVVIERVKSFLEEFT
jgi:alpha/beta superfamily hydrolase